MFTDEIKIWDAVITAISHRLKDGVLSSRIMVTGTLNEDLAKELGVAKLVFANNGAPKEGFTKLELSTGCAAFRAVFEADPALKQSFEITGDTTDNFLVERTGEGELRLKLRLNYHSDPHQVLAYALAVGSGQSHLKIVPLQESLKAEEHTEVTIAVPGREPVVTTAAAGLREAARIAGIRRVQ